MTFDELFKEFTLTEAERKELIMYLAFLRMRRTLEKLL